jgi:hypothetical protein
MGCCIMPAVMLVLAASKACGQDQIQFKRRTARIGFAVRLKPASAHSKREIIGCDTLRFVARVRRAIDSLMADIRQITCERGWLKILCERRTQRAQLRLRS